MRPPSAVALIWSAVAVGLALRAYHYLRLPPLWHDEAALVVNVLEHDDLALLGPPRHLLAAPPLFMWLERAVALVFGGGLYALRAPLFVPSHFPRY